MSFFVQGASFAMGNITLSDVMKHAACTGKKIIECHTFYM